MTTKLDWLSNVHLFVAVAQAKSFKRAAAALDLPVSTLSRKVSEFENTIGLRLLNRTTRCVELTVDGAEYLARAERIVEDAALAHEALLSRAKNLDGLVRISMPSAVAWTLAMPWIAEFGRIHQNIRIEVDTAPGHVDQVADKFDICIYDDTLPDSALTAKRIGVFDMALFANQGYLSHFGVPSHPLDLSSHECICCGERGSKTLWTLTKGLEKVSVRVSGRISVQSPGLSPFIALGGMGIAAAVPGAYKSEVARGLLIPVLPDWQFEKLVLTAVMTTKLIPAKTRLLVEFLRKKIHEVEERVHVSESPASQIN